MDNNQNTEQRSVMRRFMPLMIFAVLTVFLVIGLNNVETVRDVPSPLIGKPAPEFDLPLLLQEGRFSNQDLTGQVTLVNVWASWCFACRQEHEAVKYLARNDVRVIGLNYKDETDDAKNWLARLGNPYTAIAVDYDGRAAIDWGVYGAPETFLVDSQGIVRHKSIGPINSPKNIEGLLEVASEHGYTRLAELLSRLK
jgi:cytochrome c biogenesis protein CcmG/thiol:disulfide interchange protein DsbE